VEDRQRRHFASGKLYLHVLVTALVAYVLIGWQYWPVALVILVTHFLIDGWKSYRPQRARYFLIDQFLHLAVIVGCWLVVFRDKDTLGSFHRLLNTDVHGWIVLVGFVFVTSPAGILIGQLTRQWSRKIDDPENSLANAGKWIGIVERIIVVILVLQNQYSAIGLLITAKGIIRFNEIRPFADSLRQMKRHYDSK
jgi:hypothetical protein